mmetsp:Transcript_60667/g.142866  ORF Transcript_60667/g.142866 Transcript_60667/m.142866 type:complete len:324 (-) Transcript_60667:45-1016(-)
MNVIVYTTLAAICSNTPALTPRSTHRRRLEVELRVARQHLPHLVLALLHLLLQVEEEAVDVLLGPLRAIDAREHAPRRILLRAVLEVCDLPVFDLLEALGVGCGLGGLHHVQVLVQVVLERIEHMRLDLLVLLRASPEERRRKVLLRLLREVTTPRQVLSVLRVHVQHVLARILGLVLVALEQRLHVDRDEVASRERHEIQTEEGKIVVHVREDDKVQHLQCSSAVHMSSADLAELRRLECIALREDLTLALALPHHSLLTNIPRRNGIRGKIQSLLQNLRGRLPERRIQVRHSITSLPRVVQVPPRIPFSDRPRRVNLRISA